MNKLENTFSHTENTIFPYFHWRKHIHNTKKHNNNLENIISEKKESIFVLLYFASQCHRTPNSLSTRTLVQKSVLIIKVRQQNSPLHKHTDKTRLKISIFISFRSHLILFFKRFLWFAFMLVSFCRSFSHIS